MGSDTKSTADVLRAAKAHISEPENWIKGSYFRRGLSHLDTSCACPLGAIRVANWSANAIHSASVYVHDNTNAAIAIERAVPDGFCSAAEFNDSFNTKHPDIMALFDRAIAAAEATQ